MSHEPSAHAHAAHTPEWEVSVWPFVISFGILFALPVAFGFKFVYGMSFAAILALGIGTPMIVAGIVGWVREGMSSHHGEGLAFPAMGWFILAEAMIFVSIFASYWFNRLTAEAWPPAGSIELPKVLPIVMTCVLVASSFTIHHAEALLQKGNRPGFNAWLIVTMVLGSVFLGMSAYEWNHLFHENFTADTNLLGTVFFTITGLHGSHVIVGLGIFLAVLVPALQGRINEPFVKTAGLYWHFVDIIWFFVVSQVYYW
ncbi:MAG: heme-copper oxidase subunit III [Burkholderiales bacterium]|jgi:cytochrome c oxidase subunit 3|uniref:Heme/copper-type cytochrome/quinol oxidase n=1 Tax=Candidatus Desulfobacillus denitrificans TaxID=2608985 RepID=A0A809RTR7_9PROT|nr:heme-copper oxidase subunit III [Zoogloeaceae bacterium]MBP9655410.1 heme-copper oxidase subunit III [Rhodocyclaceae bacterium]MCZ2174964.1 heme-copper oxidase subunit III [Burkholderiales bacterium]OQY71732.1 MAG: hypothetical protein B6D47_06120 [Rhodocyclaceae bacterium UTPRO2]BBO19596.1 heme/copper-type cytochrome/quinol oxidase [Candidatus Desulfobacillus denitrificans]GIK45726.1 MAG: cytochrome c oxidase subunit III [Betaproteobacteria bacterium]